MASIVASPSVRDIVRSPGLLLKDRVILVTGGSRGIGRAIVEEIARQGGKTVFTYAQHHDAAEAVTEQVKSTGGEVLALQADVRDLQQTQRVVAQTIERFGHLDGLVNNAGILRDKALMLMEAGDWQDVLDTNLTGVFNSCRAAIVSFMKQKSGRIINVTSVAGLVGAARQVNYAAAKAGIIGLTKSLAKEVAGYNITVNAIAPGYIETDMTSGIDEKRKAELLRQIPMGRFGRPEEIARLAVLLLSDTASYMTGQVIVADGGLIG
jgi:3-oxoacyl-[acyl-carrier protein] reductase